MIRAKKSLGQNFLIDQNIIDKIINTASIDGKELYFLPQDGDSDLLARTGISRTELFESITKDSPKNTIIFLDTCYSGVSRDEKTLLASARPVRIIADEQSTPDNFTIFSASLSVTNNFLLIKYC